MLKSFTFMSLAAVLFISSGVSALGPPRSRHSPALPVARECPVVSVASPNFDSGKDEPLIFHVTVSGVEKERKLEYEWVVSRGEIKTGQGTPSITVEVAHNGASVGAKVKVKGLPDGCSGEAVNYITHY